VSVRGRGTGPGRGLVAPAARIIGHGVGKGILKPLKEEGGVEAAVRVALSGLNRQGRQTVVHGEERGRSEGMNRHQEWRFAENSMGFHFASNSVPRG
jgi:hypothetical protein